MERTAERTASTAVDARRAVRLSRGITVTWWYMALAVVVFELFVVALSISALAGSGTGPVPTGVVAASGVVWFLTTLLPLHDYRRRSDAVSLVVRRRHLAPLVTGVVFGLAAGVALDLWVLGALPVLQAAVLLNWPSGTRARLVLAATALLVALAVIDSRLTLAESGAPNWTQLVFLSTVLPAITVSSLWWWDVIEALDRARVSEARLAAAQERLRVATDVHDLQGHHLQVVALQLELAERLLPGYPDAGMAQLAAARVSVDEARQGTRDLATRFRSVPLADELANAVDLLRAAGTNAVAEVDPDAAAAPAGSLGPVVRETTTNALRHGGGGWARLRLTRTDGTWRYEISNDVTGRPPDDTGGSGLDGIARRAAEGGGDLEVRRDDSVFTVVVTVPADVREAG
ncbi:two-component system sensor protein [Pseudonocardia sp. Ae168_Ps1]|uniref:sensor histidine kinase n=1 Tax=unclassified Pseudonocardia TaxID=2619320 RepID=UPI00094B2C04|nr:MULTISPECIES: histidine kinase [unclassified Pseudonocardia]OLL76459.1 two-component system sensor protein [Pseudonocardia sp. Ae150A_Ps1]OLL82470.1 two-component system sensor protein [Pseudonocardia sp. Ae168_Ps1]OLL90545.1 two-component system sensor protein [Pseudonocardia sp. Ae356_Ps1]